MRLNNDCIRDILLSVETMEYGDIWSINNLIEALPSYTENELQYHCLKLHEAGYLNALIATSFGHTEQIVNILDLTYEGHQFLANIRSDNAWNKTKEIAKSVGTSSLDAIKEIAVNVISSAIHSQFGLP